MTTQKIYSPWLEWHGGECPVPPDTLVKIKLRSGAVMGPSCALGHRWDHHGTHGDIVEYCVVTDQADLDAAEQLLRANGYTVTPPAKPLTFEDVEPMTEAPENRTEYWTLDAMYQEGVASFYWSGDKCDELSLKRRMAYLDKEHALIAARHIFGLKGGEL